MSTVNLILLTHLHPSIVIEIGVGLDCLSVLYNLQSNKTIFLISQYIHKVVREIYLIKDKQNIAFRPEKIKAHQDKVELFQELDWLKQLNVLYDERAKDLIQSEEREFVEWLFHLSSPYIVVKHLSQVLSKKVQVKLYIDKVKSFLYLKDKLKIALKFEKIS